MNGKNCSFIENLNIILAFDELCISLKSNGVKEALDGVSTNHEEADIRMLLYAKLIIKKITRILLFRRQNQMFSSCLATPNKIIGSLVIRTCM